MHWRNSAFQTTYFIAGACHTADEVYRKLLEQREERFLALKSTEANAKRQEAKVLRAQKALKSRDKIKRLEAEADLLEVEAFRDSAIACYLEAQREVEYLDKLIEQIQPFRKYAHLPDHEAHQLAQREEWKQELIYRSENFLLTSGTIPHDHYATMRQHPDFEAEIAPAIFAMKQALFNGQAGLFLASGNQQDFQKALTQSLPAPDAKLLQEGSPTWEASQPEPASEPSPPPSAS